MENSISLILCVNGSCGFSEVVLKNTLKKAGVDYQLLVYSKKVSPQIRHLFEKASDVFVDGSEFENTPQALNYLLDYVTGSKIVFVPYEAVLPENWLFDFINYFDSFDQIGALTTPFKVDTLETKPVQVLDANFDVQTLYSSENGDHFGITCIKRDTSLLVGAFDESLTTFYSFKQYLYRIAMTGFKNYCFLSIPSTNLLKHDCSKSEHDLYQSTLTELLKTKNPFIQLHTLTELQEIAYHDLDNVIHALNNNCQKFCSKYTSRFGLICENLNKKQLGDISKFARKYGFQFKIEPYREVVSGCEKWYLTIIF